MKNKLNTTLKKCIALILMGVIATSSVACSSTSVDEKDQATAYQVENSAVQSEEAVATPADLIQVEPIVDPIIDTVAPKLDNAREPVVLSVFSESVTTINENGEEQTTIQKVITATVEPEGASASFSWSVDWHTNNAGANAVATDYLTVEPVLGQANKATIIAHQAFPNSKITVTATARGSGISGSCVVSFVGLPTDITLTALSSSAVKLYDEDWGVDIWHVDGNCGFKVELDNPFHYLSSTYTTGQIYKQIEVSAYAVGNYGFVLYDGATPIYGKFSNYIATDLTIENQTPPTFTSNNACVQAGGFLSELTSLLGQYRFYYSKNNDFNSGLLSDKEVMLNTLSKNLARIDAGEISASMVETVNGVYVSGINNFSRSGYVFVDENCDGNKSSNENKVYQISPYYVDGKLPYVKFVIRCGNAEKTLNVRFGDKITGVSVNGGEVLL